MLSLDSTRGSQNHEASDLLGSETLQTSTHEVFGKRQVFEGSNVEGLEQDEDFDLNW